MRSAFFSLFLAQLLLINGLEIRAKNGAAIDDLSGKSNAGVQSRILPACVSGPAPQCPPASGFGKVENDELVLQPYCLANLTSPGWDGQRNSYPHGPYTCIWKFRVVGPSGQIKVRASHSDFELESSPECLNDHLEIDGIMKESETKVRLCGELTSDKTFKSSGDSITVTFHADHWHQKKGFNLQIIGRVEA